MKNVLINARNLKTDGFIRMDDGLNRLRTRVVHIAKYMIIGDNSLKRSNFKS